MQPSAQGIASLFMGNPGALAARVDQDRKQSPMGIPDDLRQLMALNIVTTENDAAKRQQALQQLQQMAPNGQPPTVAENVRQQAAQKLQARMVQEQQKAQAMQQMMGGLPAAGIPQGVPQPERQPQGIDQAPVEFGMAGGGIVSFQEGGSPEVQRILKKSPRDRTPEENAALEQAGYKLQRQVIPQDSAVRRADEAIREVGTALRRSVSAGTEQLSDEELASQPSFGGALNERILRTLGMGPAAPATPPARTAPIPTSQGPGDRVVPRYPTSAPAPAPVAKDLRDAARVVSKPTPTVAEAPAPAPAAPAFQDPRLSPQGMSNMASAGQLQAEADYERRVGAPSTAALDKLMAELERQKAATEGPKAGWEGLAEYMAQIAAGARPGRSSLQAGAAGALGVQALEKERAAQRAALTEKQIGLEQQKLNAARDYAKEVFGVGKAAYDKEYERNFNMFKAQGEDVRAAERRAHEMTLEDLRYKRQIEQEERRFKNDLKLRGTPTAEMQRQDRLIKMYMKEQEAKGNKVTYLEAVQAVGAFGQTERAATPTDRLRAAQSMLENAETDAERAMAKAEIARIMGASQTQRSTTPPAVGTIMDGYKFKGGNPADSKNWEKV